MLPSLLPGFLKGAEISHTLFLLMTSAWYPCPLQEEHFPLKRCTKLNVSHFASKLKTFNLSVPYVAVTMDLPSTQRTMRHYFHYDVFPERNTTTPPNATVLVYLTDSESTLPMNVSGRTMFPRSNLSIVPRAGTLVSWKNTLPDGSRNPYSLHGVGPYAGTIPRIAFQIPIDGSLGTSEHVGCGSGSKGRRSSTERRLARELERAARWREIAVRHLWNRVRRHALIVGKFVRAMKVWYTHITTTPPNGQAYQESAKRFKTMQ